MKRTTAEAHSANRYSEGNPSLGIPATVVGAEEMNNIQEEIVNVVLDRGLALDAGDETQLLQALRLLIGAGGQNIANFAIADNVSNTNVSVLTAFDKTTVKSARVSFDLLRRDDSQSKNETGELFITHNTETDTWKIFSTSHDQDAEVTWSISSTGQVRYSSSNFGGANYSGTLRLFGLKTRAQTL